MREDSSKRASEPQAVSIFVAYDHLEAGARAKASCERLGHGEEFSLDLQLAPFASLKISPARLFTPPEALRSDILVVAWSQPGVLPVLLLDWLRVWAVRRGVMDAALAALPVGAISQETTAATAIHQLRELATAHHLTFICDWTDGLGMPHDDFQTELRQREQSLTPTLAAILSDSHFDPHLDWGLND